MVLDRKAYNKKWREEHREHLRNYARKYRQKHRDHIRRYHQKYREEHKEHLKNMLWKRRQRPAVKNKRRKYYQEHREQISSYKRKYHQEHREEIISRMRKKYRNNGFFTQLQFLKGDGCCLICFETNPFMLENHHIFGKKSNDLKFTFCANHHVLLGKKPVRPEILRFFAKEE